MINKLILVFVLMLSFVSPASAYRETCYWSGSSGTTCYMNKKEVVWNSTTCSATSTGWGWTSQTGATYADGYTTGSMSICSTNAGFSSINHALVCVYLDDVGGAQTTCNHCDGDPTAFGGCGSVPKYCGSDPEVTDISNFADWFSSHLNSLGWSTFSGYAYATIQKSGVNYVCYTGGYNETTKPIQLDIVGGVNNILHPETMSECLTKSAYDAMICTEANMAGQNSGIYGDSDGTTVSSHVFTDADLNGYDDVTGISGNSGAGGSLTAIPSSAITMGCVDVNSDGFDDNTGKACLVDGTTKNAVDSTGAGITNNTINTNQMMSIVTAKNEDGTKKIFVAPSSTLGTNDFLLSSGDQASLKNNFTSAVSGSFSSFSTSAKTTGIGGLIPSFFGSLPTEAGTAPVLTWNGGTRFGTHQVDLGTYTAFFAILKTLVIFVCTFIAIRNIFLKGGSG